MMAAPFFRVFLSSFWLIPFRFSFRGGLFFSNVFLFWFKNFKSVLCFFLGASRFRWKTLPLPRAGMRTSLHPAVEFAATPSQSRCPAGAGQEQAVSVRHMRQRLRHRVLSAHPHGQGNQNFFFFSLLIFMKFEYNFSPVDSLAHPIFKWFFYSFIVNWR